MVSAVSGDVGGSAKKVGKRIKKLERIYGIKNGNNQHSSLPNNSEPSQSDLAMRMGMSVDTLRKYMVNNSSSRKRYASPKAGTELYLDLVFRQ